MPDFTIFFLRCSFAIFFYDLLFAIFRPPIVDHAITSSPVRQFTSSPDHQITRSPGHQITRSPDSGACPLFHSFPLAKIPRDI
jgi:hypothetical protein